MNKLKIGELIDPVDKIYNMGETPKETYIFSEEITDPEYRDITSNHSWDLIGSRYYDYVNVRFQIRWYSSGVGFANLTSMDKEIALRYCEPSVDDLIPYIMSKGYSQAEAIDIYVTNYSVDIRNASNCFDERVTNPAFTKYLLLYLGQDGGETFLDACRNFLADLRDSAVIGTQYNNNRDGIMDYINGTGSYVGGGLRNYTTQYGLNIEDLITKLNGIILYGEY